MLKSSFTFTHILPESCCDTLDSVRTAGISSSPACITHQDTKNGLLYPPKGKYVLFFSEDMREICFPIGWMFLHLRLRRWSQTK